MREISGIIFDMDGCLYPLDRGSGKTFGESEFGRSIKRKEILFIQNRLGVDAHEAVAISHDLKERYDRHLSLGLEYEFAIPRDEFFTATWDLDVAEHVDEQPGLPQLLGRLATPIGLLSAAPKIWVDRVLTHLGVRSTFEPVIFCGDLDVRKPSPEAFAQVAMRLCSCPQNTVSIGDQEHTDIVPAQSLGMVTVRIGDDTTTNADFLASDIRDAFDQLKKAGFEL